MDEALAYRIAGECLKPLYRERVSTHLTQQVADKISAALLQCYENGLTKGKQGALDSILDVLTENKFKGILEETKN